MFKIYVEACFNANRRPLSLALRLHLAGSDGPSFPSTWLFPRPRISSYRL